MFQFRADDDDDMETFGKSRAAEMIYFRVSWSCHPSSVQTPKEEQTNQRKICFQFFEKTAKRFCLYNTGGGVKNRRLNNRLSQFTQDKRQLPAPPPLVFPLSASSTCRRNLVERKMSRNFLEKVAASPG